MAIEHLTKENFDEVTGSGRCVVDFWATWCGPCRMQAPILDEVDMALDGRAKVCKVDVDEQPELASRFGVMSIPTLIYFQDGKVTGKAAGYQRAKLTIKLINSVADVVNNDPAIKGRLKVVFIEDYRVSNAEWIFAAADVSEQISTASKEASGTGNMKFMLNGAVTLGTMDGANVEIVEEVGEENAFIFGMSSDEVIALEKQGGYDPSQLFNTDQDIRHVLMQLINGEFSPQNPELFRELYNSLLIDGGYNRPDPYFILKDFRSYAEAQERVEAAYRDTSGWAKKAMINVACSGKFTSDRTIKEYVDEIWKLDKVTVKLEEN